MGLGYVVLPAAMVFLQPDLGTATVIGVMGLGLLFFFGTRWTHFVALAGRGYRGDRRRAESAARSWG